MRDLASVWAIHAWFYTASRICITVEAFSSLKLLCMRLYHVEMISKIWLNLNRQIMAIRVRPWAQNRDAVNQSMPRLPLCSLAATVL